MQTQAKQTIWYSLYGRMVELGRLEAAFRKVKAANGAPGIDGVVIYTTFARIQDKKAKAFKEKVKQLTGRNRGSPAAEIITVLNPVMRGFANYFRIANCRDIFKALMAWVRRRLRAV